MKRLNNIIALTLIIIFAGACNSTKVETYKTLEAKKDTAEGIDFFHGTFQEAKILAKEHKIGTFKKKPERLIFVDAYTTWCGPCKMMSKYVFTKPEAGEYFDENFINVKVDCEKGEGIQLAREWRITAYPTLLILSPDGEVIARQIGAIGHEQLIKWGKEITEYYEKNKKEGAEK